MFQTLTAARVLFALGIVNLVTGLMVLFTCRCLPTSRLGHNWLQHGKYKSFYKYHCYYWWVFWISVIIHAIFGLGLIGNPFS